ncbi:MAG: magnesium transporter [Gammaproteobacteria bacterium]|nr:magnesium transporter [Gammaproteobacteria bacterium]
MPTPILDQRIQDILSRGSFHQIGKILNQEVKPVDVARLIESSPPRERQVLWGLISEENTGHVLQHLDDEVRAEFLAELQAEEIAESFTELSDDDITDLLQQLPALVMEQVLDRMQVDERERVTKLLDYPAGTVGAIMSTEFLTVRPYIELEVVLRYLRRRKDKITFSAGKLAVVNEENKFIGVLPVTTLVQSPPDRTVSDIMETDIVTLNPNDDDKQAVEVFERYDLVSLPVVDEDKNLLGMVTVDDVFDLALEQRDKAMLSGAGISNEEDTFAPLKKVANNRIFWLGINLGTVLMASMFIGLFQDTLDKIVALAILMPIVASMGGIAGIQSMTIMVRAQTLGRITSSNIRWLFTREALVGLINGLIWSLVVSVLSYIWFEDQLVTMALAGAMIINLLLGSGLGVILPLILERNNIDPANAGGVILTTFTDIIGFVAFLGIASILYFN